MDCVKKIKTVTKESIMKKTLCFVMFTALLACCLTAQSNLELLKQKARDIMSKKASTTSVETLKQQIPLPAAGSSGQLSQLTQLLGGSNLNISNVQQALPVLQNISKYSGAIQNASGLLGGQTSSLSQSLANSYQDASNIYTSAQKLFEISQKLKNGYTKLSSADISELVNQSQSIYNSSGNLMKVISENSKMVQDMAPLLNNLGSSSKMLNQAGGLFQKLAPMLSK